MKFKSVYTGVPYVPTAAEPDAGDSGSRQIAQSPMRIREFTAAPIAETAAVTS